MNTTRLFFVLAALSLAVTPRASAEDNLVLTVGGTGSFGGGSFHTGVNNITRVFDGDTTTFYAIQNAAGALWYAFEFTTPTVVNGYGIGCGPAAYYSATSRAPKTFALQAYDETSETWVVLDERSGESGWVVEEIRAYDCYNVNAYSQYRLLQALPTGYTGISELQFYYVDHADRLTVTGAPAAVGSPTPDYGVQTAVTGGTQIACSVGETIAVDGNGTAWLYAGYTLKQGGMNVTGGVETTDFTYTHGGDAVLEWKWVQSDTIHIATNGNDSASGVSWATAKKTIDAALSAALDGQTIILSNGVYQLKSTVTITKAVTLTGFGGAENTVISTTNNIQLLTISKAAAVVKDLTFAGGTYFSDSTGYPDTPPLLCAGVLVTAGMLTNCTVRDCSVVRHAGGAALCVNGANALVAGCTITNNTAKAYGTGGRPYFLRGCAVTMTAGRVEDCEIAWNVGGSGVGAAVTGGTLANCRIHDNTGSYVGTLEGGAQPGENNAYSYGTVYIMGGTVTDCLIVGNRAATAAGVYLFKGGTLTNSIVADNVATMDYLGLDDSMNPKVMPEPGRRTGVGGVLVYGTSSRVVDCTITNNTSVWFGSGQGVTLLLGTVEDCRLKANGEAGGTAADFVSIGGTSGGLTITPRASGEGPSVTYAAPNDGAEGVYPYDTPEKAARTIQAAIDAVVCPAGGLGTVVLLPGVHTNVAHGVWVNKVIKPVELVGQDGRDATFIDGLHLAHHRPLWLANRDAEVRGITLRNGNENGSGGNPWGSSVPSAAVLAQGTVDDCAVTGCVKSANSTAVFVTEGVVTNCVIANNYTGGYGDYDTGGGIRVYCGTVTDCVISNNAACNVGGVYVGASSAVVDRCIIERNRATAYENNAGGAGVYIAAGRVSNSLIVGNRVTKTGSNAKQGAGVQMAGGELVNCTVVSNTQATVAMTAGVYNHGGAVKNCIIWENGRDNAAPNLTLASGSITYSCYPDTAVAADPAYHNVIAEQPGFRTSGLPWRLGSLSPCVNAGAPGNWSAADRDLAGAARVFRKVVDIGAYEQTSAPALFILLQ